MVTVSVNEVLDGIGMIGFALAGLLATQGRKMDPVGVFVATFTTAFGGGIVRDLMLDLRPFYWSSHPQYVWLAVLLTLFAPTIIRRMRVKWRNILYVAADAIGLAFFSVGSTITALNTGANATTSILLGVTTGVFGGLLRDVFLNRTPAVLSDKTPYATAAFLGCLTYVLGIHVVPEPAVMSTFCGSMIFFIRMATYYQHGRYVSYHWLGKLFSPMKFSLRLYRHLLGHEPFRGSNGARRGAMTGKKGARRLSPNATPSAAERHSARKRPQGATAVSPVKTAPASNVHAARQTRQSDPVRQAQPERPDVGNALPRGRTRQASTAGVTTVSDELPATTIPTPANVARTHSTHVHPPRGVRHALSEAPRSPVHTGSGEFSLEDPLPLVRSTRAARTRAFAQQTSRPPMGKMPKRPHRHTAGKRERA